MTRTEKLVVLAYVAAMTPAEIAAYLATRAGKR